MASVTAKMSRPMKAKRRKRSDLSQLQGPAKPGTTIANVMEPTKPRGLGETSCWTSTAGAYDAGRGVYEEELSLCLKRIPVAGPCVNTSEELETLRRAVNGYRDAYNNGGGNLEDDICEIFPITRSSISACNTIAALDETLDRLILEAYRAENALHSF